MGNVNVYRVGGILALSRFLVPKVFLPLAIMAKARELIKSGHQYKLVHIFQASQAGGAARLLKFYHPNLPILLTMQEGKDLEAQGFFIKLFRMAIIRNVGQATAISRYLKNYLQNIRSGLPVTVIPNGVDMADFSLKFSYGELSSLKDRLGIKPGEKVIISVSRLVRKNGLDDLIRAAEILKYEHEMPEHKLLLIGDGEDQVVLGGLADKLNVSDRVIFAGSVEHADLPKYLKISDVFVRPSRSEGLGTAFIEAMAAGVPVIGTPVGGIPDFLRNGKTGVFCRPNDPQSIADKIKAVLLNADLRERIVRNARELVIENYNWDEIANEYEKIYQKYLK